MPKEYVNLNIHIDSFTEAIELLQLFGLETDNMDPGDVMTIFIAASAASLQSFISSLGAVGPPLNEEQQQRYDSLKEDAGETLEYFTKGGPPIPPDVAVNETPTTNPPPSIDWSKMKPPLSWDQVVKRSSAKDQIVSEAYDESIQQAICHAYANMPEHLWGTNAARQLINMIHPTTDDA